MVVDITVDQIIQLHHHVEGHYKVARGKDNIGLIESIAARPNQAVYGHIPFDNIFMKCASLLEGIIRWHPFTDGNKRTGLLAAISYLEINGYMLVTPLDAIAFAVSIAEGRLPLHKIALWLADHSADNDAEYLKLLNRHVIKPGQGIVHLLKQGKEEDAEKIIKGWIAYEAHKDEYTFEQQSDEVLAFVLDLYFKGLKPVYERISPKEPFEEVLRKANMSFDPVENLYRFNPPSAKDGKSS